MIVENQPTGYATSFNLSYTRNNHNSSGFAIGVNRVRSYMQELGLKTIYPTKAIRTTFANPEHQKYPYLLRELEINRANQVWSNDITYGVPGAQGEHGCSNESRVHLKYPVNERGVIVH